jgi:hypothetical protein
VNEGIAAGIGDGAKAEIGEGRERDVRGRVVVAERSGVSREGGPVGTNADIADIAYREIREAREVREQVADVEQVVVN